jgi:hypothetical protein
MIDLFFSKTFLEIMKHLLEYLDNMFEDDFKNFLGLVMTSSRVHMILFWKTSCHLQKIYSSTSKTFLGLVMIPSKND